MKRFLAKLGIVALLASAGCKQDNRKIMPYEAGGLPYPFMTELIDNDKDGMPDQTFLHSIGPMGYNGQTRKPTQEEIKWYKGHGK